MPAPKGNKFAEGNDGGRPTKYTPEFIELAKDYLENYEEKYDDAIPSIAGLAVASSISRETLNVWKSEEGKEEYSDILAKLLATQENVLVNKGLKNEFNSNITKLVLGKHGHHEKHDNTHGGPNGKPIEVEDKTKYEGNELARRLAFVLSKAVKDE